MNDDTSWSRILLLLAKAIVVLAVQAAFVDWTWNLIIPDLLGVPSITFWQSACLLVLCNLLFKPSGRDD